MKKNNKWSKRRKDRMLIRFIFAPFLLWVSNIFFDLAIIISNKKIVLILELRTLMEGEYLFCLQEYRYCFASKNTMIHKYLVLIYNTKHSMSLSEDFQSWLYDQQAILWPQPRNS